MTDDPRAAAFEQALTDEVLLAALSAWHLDYSESRKAMRSVLVAALLKAAPPAEGPTWQPIETAPKDVQRMLVSADGGVWIELSGQEPGQATHWMPLPTPPRDQAGKDE